MRFGPAIVNNVTVFSCISDVLWTQSTKWCSNQAGTVNSSLVADKMSFKAIKYRMVPGMTHPDKLIASLLKMVAIRAAMAVCISI